jgi:hypothetical protein
LSVVTDGIPKNIEMTTNYREDVTVCFFAPVIDFLVRGFYVEAHHVMKANGDCNTR